MSKASRDRRVRAINTRAIVNNCECDERIREQRKSLRDTGRNIGQQHYYCRIVLTSYQILFFILISDNGFANILFAVTTHSCSSLPRN